MKRNCAIFRSSLSGSMRAAHYTLVFLAVTAGGPCLRAQEMTYPGYRQGLRISNISIYSSYTYYPVRPAVGEPQTSFNAGAAASIGWIRSRAGYTVSLSYSPSYNRDITQGVNYSTFNPLNQVLSFSFGRRLGTHWSFVTSLSSSVMRTSEFIFQPTQAGRVTDVATTPDELSAAVLSGTAYNNPDLSSVLTSTPQADSPTRRQVYGDRVLNASLQTGLNYTRSRISLRTWFGASRSQALDSGDIEEADPSVRVAPPSTTGLVGIGVNYSLAPRTQIGFVGTGAESRSRLEDSFINNLEAHLARRLSQRWSMDVRGGVGFTISKRSVYPVPPGAQILSGGSLSFKPRAHAFLFSFDRSLADQYGLGPTTSTRGTAGWTWQLPGRAWKVGGSAGVQRSHSAGYPVISGLIANVEASRVITRHVSVYMMYAYLQDSQAIADPRAARRTTAPAWGSPSSRDASAIELRWR